MDARLHTAVSSGLVNSMISVHRLEHLMVPRFYATAAAKGWGGKGQRMEKCAGLSVQDYTGYKQTGLQEGTKCMHCLN